MGNLLEPLSPPNFKMAQEGLTSGVLQTGLYEFILGGIWKEELERGVGEGVGERGRQRVIFSMALLA